MTEFFLHTNALLKTVRLFSLLKETGKVLPKVYSSLPDETGMRERNE